MGKRELKYGGIQGLLLEWYNRILHLSSTYKCNFLGADNKQ